VHNFYQYGYHVKFPNVIPKIYCIAMFIAVNIQINHVEFDHGHLVESGPAAVILYPSYLLHGAGYYLKS
jgi:hypothetical protein